MIMNKLKENTELIIRMGEILETLEASGNPSNSTHEVVLPECMVYDVPAGWPNAVGHLVCYEASELVDYAIQLFGYDVRYDPNAHAMDVLLKQVEAPLPFDKVELPVL